MVTSYLTWNEFGLIPPVLEDKVGSNRSPYMCSLADFIEKFCTSFERYNILKGFISYRNRLHAVGIDQGIQWINGSFTQDIERTGDRSPNDIDVVSFIDSLSEESQKIMLEKDLELFNGHAILQEKYKVDAYIMPILGSPTDLNIIKKISYWYSMWSHRREDDKWKGFIQVCLSVEETERAVVILEKKEAIYE